MKYIDLFCGIGSFHYSFKKFGWECVMACDLEESARNTYKKNMFESVNAQHVKFIVTGIASGEGTPWGGYAAMRIGVIVENN